MTMRDDFLPFPAWFEALREGLARRFGWTATPTPLVCGKFFDVLDPGLRRVFAEEMAPQQWGAPPSGETLPPSDLGRSDAIPLRPRTGVIPPDPENWAEQNKRICDLLAGRG